MQINWRNIDIKTRKAIYKWDVDYAAIVHEGGTTSTKQDYPARPWVNRTVEGRFDIVNAFEQELNTASTYDAMFDNVAEQLGDAFKQSIEAEIYSWDNETKRKNGMIVGSPRDIVDIGDLRDSQTMELI